MPPIGQPGALTESERFLFETTRRSWSTPGRSGALLGVWQRPEEPFGQGCERPPFED